MTNLINLMMVCNYRSSCLDLTVVLVDFQVEGCPSRLHRVFQGDYVILNYIDFDGEKRKIFTVVLTILGLGHKFR